jgi:hypothetical protein
MPIPTDGLALYSFDAPPLRREHVLRSLRVLRTHGRDAMLREFGFSRAERFALRLGLELFDPEAVVNLALAELTGQRPLPGHLGGITEPEASARLARLGFEVVSPQPLPLAADLARASYVERPLHQRLDAARAGLPADAALLIRTEPGRLPDYALSPGDLSGQGTQPLAALETRFTVPAWAQPDHSLLDLWQVLQVEPQVRLFVAGEAGSGRILGVILAEDVLQGLEDLRRLHAFVAASGLAPGVLASPQPPAELRYACGGPPAHMCQAAEITRDASGGPHCAAHRRPAPPLPGRAAS